MDTGPEIFTENSARYLNIWTEPLIVDCNSIKGTLYFELLLVAFS
jgi:hypothetical protein